MNDRFTRIKWLVGEEKFQKISQTKVLVCGLGGVGGICVDALPHLKIPHQNFP